MIEDTLPPPSLETVLRFDYHGDDNHAGFNTDLDDSAVSTFSLLYAQRYKTFNLITSLAHFNMAHVVADSTADLPVIVVVLCSHHTQVTAIRHLFARNHFRSPILILSNHAAAEEWVECFHAYTPLKVALLRGGSRA